MRSAVWTSQFHLKSFWTGVADVPARFAGYSLLARRVCTSSPRQAARPPAGARPGAPALNNRAIDATEVSQKMHAVANTVRLGLHDVLGAHHRARILISIGT